MNFSWKYFSLILAVSTLPACRGPAQDFEKLRKEMCDLQLAGRNIKNERVLRAMAEVPRHELVPEKYRAMAYEDRPLPIGFEQTISQPFIVAFMTEQLDPQPGEKVLEIGTGSGYQAAVLARLVEKVFSIEIVEPLAARAAADLKRLGVDNVEVKAGDGYRGWPEHAPFDSIIVTCAPDHIPKPLIEQLKDGGKMIIPVGPAGDQKLYLLVKRGKQMEQRATLAVRFVPMTRKAEP